MAFGQVESEQHQVADQASGPRDAALIIEQAGRHARHLRAVPTPALAALLTARSTAGDLIVVHEIMLSELHGIEREIRIRDDRLPVRTQPETVVDDGHLYAADIESNVAAFDATLDDIRDQVRMGGENGDPYYDPPGNPLGPNSRCDENPANFWVGVNGYEARSAVVTLRRIDETLPGGLATGVTCVNVAAGTHWELSEIYLR